MKTKNDNPVSPRLPKIWEDSGRAEPENSGEISRARITDRSFRGLTAARLVVEGSAFENIVFQDCKLPALDVQDA
ncbi:MAG TPA: hypothetical protein VHR42_08710, partial [Clostridia bacterium]|nr:hypothetical protein [Clostridia bacterium]